MQSQNKAIKKHLKSGKTLTPLQALKLFGTMRLASRVCELKDEDEGMDILTTMVKVGRKRVARYSL